jgi:hypothetical protein
MDAEVRDKCGHCGHSQSVHQMSYCTHHDDRQSRCSCRGFVSPIHKELSVLSYEDRERLACAMYLEIPPERVHHVASETDGSGHYTGFRVNCSLGSVPITVERYLEWWVRLHLPREMTNEIRAFIDKHGTPRATS